MGNEEHQRRVDAAQELAGLGHLIEQAVRLDLPETLGSLLERQALLVERIRAA